LYCQLLDGDAARQADRKRPMAGQKLLPVHHQPPSDGDKAVWGRMLDPSISDCSLF